MSDSRSPCYDLWVIEHLQVPRSRTGGPYSSVHVVLIKDCSSSNVIFIRPFYHYGAEEVIASLQSAIDSAGRAPDHIYIDGPLCMSKKLEGFCIAMGIFILIYPPSGINWPISERRLWLFREKIKAMSRECGTMSLYYLEHTIPGIWEQIPCRPAYPAGKPRRKEAVT